MVWLLVVWLVAGVFTYAGETRLAYWGPSGYGASNLPVILTTNLQSIITGDDSAISIQGGGLALKADGTVVQWGQSYEADLSGLTNIMSIAKSPNLNAALSKEGTLYMWSGPISPSNSTNLSVLSLADPATIVDIGSYDYGCWILRKNGTVDRTDMGKMLFTNAVSGVISFEKQTANTLIMVKANGGYWANGNNYSASNYGVSNDIAVSIARPISGGPFAFVLSGGTVFVQNSSPSYPPPSGLTNAIKVAGGLDCFLALKSDGSVVRWGSNTNLFTPPTNLSGLKTITSYGGLIGLVSDSSSTTAAALAPEVANILAADPVFLSRLSSNNVFVSQVGNQIGTNGLQYGLLSSNQVASFATKSELTNALSESRADGVNSVLSNPNLWTLYTTSQIHGMAMGNLMLTRTNNGQFVLNYDIEQSEDLVNWTPYQGYAMPLTNLPTDKAFVRIKLKNQQ
jgi:hypothetical protein